MLKIKKIILIYLKQNILLKNVKKQNLSQFQIKPFIQLSIAFASLHKLQG
jgi:hypothetical protein